MIDLARLTCRCHDLYGGIHHSDCPVYDRLADAVSTLREIAHAHESGARGLRLTAADALIRLNTVDQPPAGPTEAPHVPTHYILVKPWAVYVKEAAFFRRQGGLAQAWGREWRPVIAGSIEEARAIGEVRRGSRAANHTSEGREP